MANTKISALTAGAPAQTTDILPIDRAGANFSLTVANINAAVISAPALSISGQTGLLTVAGLTSTNRIKTVGDAADTLLELGGSYTPTGTWTSLTMVTPVLGTPTSGNLANCTFPTLNQNTSGTAGGLIANATIDGIATATIPTAPIIFATSASTAFGVFNTGAAVTMLASTGTPVGMYRISFQLTITTTFVTNTAVTLAFKYTDESGTARTITLTGGALTAGTSIPALGTTTVVPNSIVIMSNGTAAITYTPAKTGSSATAGAAWLAVTLERLA